MKESFDPNNLGFDNGNIYGLPFGPDESQVIVFPVPWDVTVSYIDGTSQAPEKIREESLQVDLYDLDYHNFWDKGIFYTPPPSWILEENKINRAKAERIIHLLSINTPYENSELVQLEDEVNKSCEKLKYWVQKETSAWIEKGKKVVLLGGDHSTPLGYMEALSKKQPFGILQIDAHCDLRESYENFIYSHASIMYNAMKLDGVMSLTQVGIRDFCEEEVNYQKNSTKPVHFFYDRKIKERLYGGATWQSLCDLIVDTLPNHVYISFDVDGLNPTNCPNTGTPVLGGLEPDQVFYLFNQVLKSGRHIIGMDLNEVGPERWDANVGARLLYRMIGLWMSH